MSKKTCSVLKRTCIFILQTHQQGDVFWLNSYHTRYHLVKVAGNCSSTHASEGNTVEAFRGFTAKMLFCRHWKADILQKNIYFFYLAERIWRTGTWWMPSLAKVTHSVYTLISCLTFSHPKFVQCPSSTSKKNDV